MKKSLTFFPTEIFFFSLFFLIFFILQAKTLTTGDGGELIGASFGLGIAHPSGYPLYLLLGKLFTFLPLGNIPLKVVLLSSLPSAIILTLIFSYLKKHYSFVTGLFTALLLLSSYSFVGQSLLAKFYSLNTLVILLLFYLGLKTLEEYSLKNQLLISFLFGLSFSLHHLVFLMFIPLLIPLALHFKQVIKNILPGLLVCCLGATSTLYILIRSLKPTLINVSPSPNFSGLSYTLLRKTYQKGSSPELVKSLVFIDIDKLGNALKNSFLLLKSQFHIYAFVFFLLGLIFLFSHKNLRTKGFYLISSFITYCFILAYLTFASSEITLHTSYIVEHQYFLPALLFFALICALGFFYIENKLKKVKYFLLLFPLIYIPNNLFLNNYDSNEVAKYKTIDSLFIKPVKTIIVYSGDNDVFQGWYQKNIEKFRDDICLISAPKVESKIWDINNGCNYEIYAKSYPEIHDLNNIFNWAKVKSYMNKFRVYSSSPIENNQNLSPYLKSYYSALDFLVLPKETKINYQQIDHFNKNLRKKLNIFIHDRVCIRNKTDDLFSMSLCRKYSTFFTFLAKDTSEKYPYGKKININLYFENTNYSFNIPINNHTGKFLIQSKTIEEYNNYNHFYLYEENNN